MTEQSAIETNRDSLYTISNTAFLNFIMYELKSNNDSILESMLKNENFKERMKLLFKSYKSKQNNENLTIFNGRKLLNGFVVDELFKDIIGKISDILV